MAKIINIEEKIMQEIIKNPRISDNKIAKKTNIPVMTVNRKRKMLEEKEILNYYTSIKKHKDGLGTFSTRQLYIIKLKAGITRKKYIEAIELDPNLKIFNSRYISTTFLGEKDGHLAIIVILDAKDDHKLMDEFNGRIIKSLNGKFGKDAIEDVTTVRINDTIRIHHNYLPHFNMEKGVIKDDWPKDYIFTGCEKDEDEQLLKET